MKNKGSMSAKWPKSHRHWLVLSVIDAYCDMLYLLSQTELSCSYKSDNNSREGHSTLP